MVKTITMSQTMTDTLRRLTYSHDGSAAIVKPISLGTAKALQARGLATVSTHRHHSGCYFSRLTITDAGRAVV